MIEIFKGVFGSQLYGTDTPESDRDYKGIYLCSKEDLLLNRAEHHMSKSTKTGSGRLKNDKDDIDSEMFSIHRFFELAYGGDTCTIDMLHTPVDKTLVNSKEWEFIRNNRSKFYTKNMDSLLGYAFRQAGKYGVKGSRLNAAKIALDILKAENPKDQLKTIWDKLPIDNEHLLKYNYELSEQQDKRVWEVCTRKLMATTPINKCIETVQVFYDAYGDRARQAALDLGVDNKAISHAFRACYQLKEIYTTGDLQYPLKDRDFIRDIKIGKYKYTADGIGIKLEGLLEEVQVLAKQSNFPEKVDRKFWDDFIMELYK